MEAKTIGKKSNTNPNYSNAIDQVQNANNLVAVIREPNRLNKSAKISWNAEHIDVQIADSEWIQWTAEHPNPIATLIIQE